MWGLHQCVGCLSPAASIRALGRPSSDAQPYSLMAAAHWVHLLASTGVLWPRPTNFEDLARHHLLDSASAAAISPLTRDAERPTWAAICPIVKPPCLCRPQADLLRDGNCWPARSAAKPEAAAEPGALRASAVPLARPLPAVCAARKTRHRETPAGAGLAARVGLRRHRPPCGHKGWPHAYARPRFLKGDSTGSHAGRRCPARMAWALGAHGRGSWTRASHPLH